MARCLSFSFYESGLAFRHPGGQRRMACLLLILLPCCLVARSLESTVRLAGQGLPLPFHSIKRQFENGMWEVADFVGAELIAMNGLVLYFQSKRRFPSWTSRVRVPSPAPSFNNLGATEFFTILLLLR